METVNESSLEIRDVIEFMSSINYVPFITLAVAIPLVISLIKITHYTTEESNSKATLKRSMESFRKSRLGSKLKVNDDGYKAAQCLVETADMLESIFEEKIEDPDESLIMKIDEILNMYFADREAFGLFMYKYEYTYEVMHETVNRYVISNQTEGTHLSETIDDLIEIPYEEIVKEEGSKWLYDKGKYEHDIIKGMKALERD